LECAVFRRFSISPRKRRSTPIDVCSSRSHSKAPEYGALQTLREVRRASASSVAINPVRGDLFVEPATPNISLLFFAPPIPLNVSEMLARIPTEWAGRKTKGRALGTIRSTNRPPLTGFGSRSRLSTLTSWRPRSILMPSDSSHERDGHHQRTSTTHRSRATRHSAGAPRNCQPGCDVAACNQSALEGAMMLDRLEDKDAHRKSR